MQDCKRREKTRLIWERWRESGSIVRHEVSFEREKERMQPSWDTRLFQGLRESASAAWDEVVTRHTRECKRRVKTRLLPEIRESASVPRDEVCRAAIRGDSCGARGRWSFLGFGSVLQTLWRNLSAWLGSSRSCLEFEIRRKNKSCWCCCCCHLCPDNDNEFSPKKVRVCAERLVAGTLGDPPSHSAFCSVLGQNNLTIASLANVPPLAPTAACMIFLSFLSHHPSPSLSLFIAWRIELRWLLPCTCEVILLLLHRIKIPSASSSSSSSSFPCQQQ
jgi:hypothetical protein